MAGGLHGCLPCAQPDRTRRLSTERLACDRDPLRQNCLQLSRRRLPHRRRLGLASMSPHPRTFSCLPHHAEKEETISSNPIRASASTSAAAFRSAS